MNEEQLLRSEEDTPGSGPVEDPGATATAPRDRSRIRYTPTRNATEARLVVDEIFGKAPVDVSPTESETDAADHSEVMADAQTTSETIVDAETSELESAVAEEDDAFTDLRGVEGFDERHGEAAGLETVDALPDAGAAVSGGEEFFGLGAIASTVIPALVSKAGPVVAKKIGRHLSSRARKALRSQRSGPLAVLRHLFETAEEQPTTPAESGLDTGFDDSVAQEMARTIEVIIGKDDRVRITSTTLVPWRRYCALRIQMPTGAMYRGTGFFIGPRAIATAGHCVYIRSQGGWARRIEVIPGCNGTTRPFGQAFAASFRSVRGWVVDGRAASDYGCIVLPKGAFGGTIGSFGFAAFSNSNLLASTAVLAGYPGDKPFAELWGMGRRIKSVTANQLVYDIDTFGGQSGAPVYIRKDGKRYVVGIHNYGAASGNSATRVTAQVFANLNTWSKIV